jgi:hypothetical protein
MNVQRLQDRIDRALGRSARHIGDSYDAFRPRGTDNPLAPEKRFLRLPAAFTGQQDDFKRLARYGRPYWAGVFDRAYLQPGDYLRGKFGTFFVSAQPPLQPALCILTNRTISIVRPSAPPVAGVNSYGGLLSDSATTVLSGWPASVLFAGSGAAGDLPTETSTPTWTVLLPPRTPVLLPADRITDDLGTNYVIGSTEGSELGWRLLVTQAAS